MSELSNSTFFVIIIVDLFLTFLVFLLFPQNTPVKSLIIITLFFLFVLSVLIMATPSSLQYVVSKFNANFFSILTISFLIVPYVALLLLGIPVSITVIPYILWYVIPTLMLIISMLKLPIPNHTSMAMKIIGVIGLWIGFDHRYTSIIFDAFEGISYIFNGMWMASLIVLSYGAKPTIIQDKQQKDFGIKPTFYGWNIGSMGSILASMIILPSGLLTGFLSWNPQFTSFFDIFIGLIGIFMTIALQEELVFRGVLLQEADRFNKKVNGHHLIPLLIVSIIFGLTHWNNEIRVFVPHYIILATVAGLFYGLCYRKSGLFGAMVAHTLVDLGWSLLFQRM